MRAGLAVRLVGAAVTPTSPTHRPSRAGHLALPERGDLGWTTRAACHGHDTEGWILDGIWSAGHTADVARRVERARAVCADCPVTTACLADAVLTADGWAVRAGTTPAQRAHLVRAARATRRKAS